jgi:hypothetical protein
VRWLEELIVNERSGRAPAPDGPGTRRAPHDPQAAGTTETSPHVQDERP